MKILFLINNPPIDAVSEWEEIEVFRDKGHLTPTRDFFSTVKALEKNAEFQKEILLARKNAGLLKDGIPWKLYYYDYYLKSLSVYSEIESEKYRNFFSKVNKEATRIKEKIKNLEEFVANQLNYLIIGSFVFPGGFPITHESYPLDKDVGGEGSYKNILIRIHNKVVKNELLTYIEDNWWGINSLMNYLPVKPNYSISERDLRIVELRDKEKLPYKAITSQIVQEFKINNSESKINEDSVKTAYRRAKQRISLLTEKPQGNK